MKFSPFLRLPLATLVLVSASHLLTPSAQAHHDPEHSATQAVEQQANTVEQSSMPLGVGTVAVLGIAAGSYLLWKKRSV